MPFEGISYGVRLSGHGTTDQFGACEKPRKLSVPMSGHWQPPWW